MNDENKVFRNEKQEARIVDKIMKSKEERREAFKSILQKLSKSAQILCASAKGNRIAEIKVE